MSEQQFAAAVRLYVSQIQTALGELLDVLDVREQPDPPPRVAGSTVTIGGASHRLDGSDRARGENELVAYTTGPLDARWGVEVQVIGGRVFAVYDRAATDPGSTMIPSGGYVLSGHGRAAEWLRVHAYVGALVNLATVAEPPVAPPL